MSSSETEGWLPPDELESIKLLYFQECVEHLATLETGLLSLQEGASDPEIINTVFRSVHSIKGGAGMFGMDALAKFSHSMEAVLDGCRRTGVQPDAAAVKILLRAADRLVDLIEATRDGRVLEDEHLESCALELVALSPPVDPHRIDPAFVDSDEFDGFAFAPVPVVLDPGAGQAEGSSWLVRFQPRACLYTNANEPQAYIRELQRLGWARVELDDSRTPPLQDLDPEDSYLAWTVELETVWGESAIREVFEFVEADCDLEISPKTSAVAFVTSDADAKTAAETATVAPQPQVTAPATIRVDLERVDRLVDLVSELVISQATLAERVSAVAGHEGSSITAALDDLRFLTRDLQESVMAIRAQPIKSLFQRMSRLVREVEQMTGKSVRLLTEGDETEVDRGVIEGMIDPLTHMIRNCIDHGIEPPQARLDAGKAAQGTVRLTAAHRAGRIVIEIADDGAGIDRERVRAIAVDRGLIAITDLLNDDEIDELIFEPGFSTAETVSDLSGRGVGMDVVRRNVQALGGRVSVASRPGEGTVFCLSLPLTLAVLDGMLVTVCGQSMVVPITALLESVALRPDDVRRLGSDLQVMAIRGAHVPLIDLGWALDYRNQPAVQLQGVALLVEDDTGERVALLVDDIIGQRQVVIKSLETNYRALKDIAAATILGDGRVALILDVNAIIASQRTKRQLRSKGRSPMPEPLLGDPQSSRRELICFSVGAQEFCVDAMSVQEMRGWTPATLMPHSPSYMCGVINLRGTVLPIVDLSARLDLPATDPTARHVVVVVRIGRKLVGLLVDAVCDILAVADDAFQPTPNLPSKVLASLISGLVTVDGRAAGLLALDKLLPDLEEAVA